MEIGYKVIKKTRWSAISDGMKGNVKYPMGRMITPNKGCGPLCVFQARKAANAFNRTKTIWKIGLVVKCQYKQSSNKFVWDSSINRVPLTNLPESTVLADSVTCLE